MAGYSGTPLWSKLGVKPAHRVTLVKSPDGLASTLPPLPAGAVVEAPPRRAGTYDIVMLFVRELRTFPREFVKLGDRLAPSGALWVCWPKKTSPLNAGFGENEIRASALALETPAGHRLVDVKVCAIDEDWSALKFMRRRI